MAIKGLQVPNGIAQSVNSSSWVPEVAYFGLEDILLKAEQKLAVVNSATVELDVMDATSPMISQVGEL